jgi:hypothetical protein
VGPRRLAFAIPLAWAICLVMSGNSLDSIPCMSARLCLRILSQSNCAIARKVLQSILNRAKYTPRLVRGRFENYVKLIIKFLSQPGKLGIVKAFGPLDQDK